MSPAIFPNLPANVQKIIQIPADLCLFPFCNTLLPVAAQRALGLVLLSPLAVVAIGGLFVATFLTLIYVPVFYELFDGLRQWGHERLQRLKSE